MQIRFLQTTQSEAPDYPFQAGQVVTIPSLNTFFRQVLEPLPDGTYRAELVREEPQTETAMMETPVATTLPQRATRRRAVHV